MMKVLTNAKVHRSDVLLAKACELAGVPLTRRQASKWRNRHGAAWRARHQARAWFRERGQPTGE